VIDSLSCELIVFELLNPPGGVAHDFDHRGVRPFYAASAQSRSAAAKMRRRRRPQTRNSGCANVCFGWKADVSYADSVS
jgi:hypothetical protein